MENKIDKIEIVRDTFVQIREITPEGKFHRYVLNPDSNIDNESEEVKTICNKTWTEEVINNFLSAKVEALKAAK